MRAGWGHFLKAYWMASSSLKTRLHSMIWDGAQRCIFEAISSLPFNASAHFFLEVFSPSTISPSPPAQSFKGQLLRSRSNQPPLRSTLLYSPISFGTLKLRREL